MTTSLQTPTATPARATGEAEGTAIVASRFRKRLLLGALVIIVVFAATYALAWYNANQLSSRFYNDATASYKAGNYLDALVGYQKFDEKTNKYINYGGYVSVEKIWSSPYSWPVPAFVQDSRQRSQEIINQKLTADQAVQYVQENTGRPDAPYFGEIYLRLGELYEQQGDIKDAKDIYTSMASLFPNRKDLIAQAQQHLNKLQSEGK
jgi:tetratricopeptide (TPR) repeat protein